MTRQEVLKRAFTIQVIAPFEKYRTWHLHRPGTHIISLIYEKMAFMETYTSLILV